MRKGWLDHKPSFDHFFSGFPPFCRVIPFSDVKARDHICQLLGFYYCGPVFLMLERQTSSANYKVLNHTGINCFEDHGAEDFPFTPQILNSPQEWFDHYPSQLDRILGRKLSEIHVSSASGRGESMSLSELEGKVVSLYLCSEGSLMLKLDQVSRECKERGLEFEVVLVYMPFHYTCNVNTLMELINNHMLSNMSDARSWWIMPYIDSISRRLWRMTPSFTFFEEDDTDKLIIVGPNGKYVDPYAGAFLGKYGVDVYPFTCELLIEWKMEKVRSATLESLLVHGSRDFVLGKDDNDNNGSGGFLKKVPVKQLNGKVVLVCFYYYHTEGPHRATQAVAKLSKYYDEIKSRHPNFEVVSVSLGLREPYDEIRYNIGTPPWLVCPPQPDHSKCVYDTLGIHGLTIVAFGEDGRVCSLTVADDLSEMGVDAFPFKGGDLRREVTRALTMENGFWNIPELTTPWSPRGEIKN